MVKYFLSVVVDVLQIKITELAEIIVADMKKTHQFNDI